MQNFRQNLIVVDCRWCYEYAAGHFFSQIDDGFIEASNFCHAAQLQENLLNNVRLMNSEFQFLFYCEFSQVRARKLASWFQSIVLKQEMQSQVFLLEGGFNNLVHWAPDLVRGVYLPENSVNYEEQRMFFSENGLYSMGIML